MSRDEKYSLFEAVTFQALGRRIDAKLMDEEISSYTLINGTVESSTAETQDRWTCPRGNLFVVIQNQVHFAG